MAKKILVAEDERAMSKALILKLVNEGFEVKNANNGLEAVSMLEKEKFDILLLDLMMPQLDGFGVLEKIQKTKGNMKIIITSNLSQGEDIERAKKMGVSDFLVKSETPIFKIVEVIKNKIRN